MHDTDIRLASQTAHKRKSNTQTVEEHTTRKKEGTSRARS